MAAVVSSVASDDIEVVHSSELFPKKPTVSDDGTLPLLTSEMHGESVMFVGPCGKDCKQFLELTTYRMIHVLPKQWFTIMPIGMIQTVESTDSYSLSIRFKDGRQCSIAFNSTERCSIWNSRFATVTLATNKIQDFYAFAFHAWLIDTNDSLKVQSPDSLSWFYSENSRLGFRDHPLWRISDGNVQFEVCRSYPHLTIVPHSFQDADILQIAKQFRSQGRYPAVVWRHRQNGAVLVRCSQPLVGFLGYQRCVEDEKLLEEIAKAVVLDRALMKGVITRAEASRCAREPCSLRTALGEELSNKLEALSLLVVDMRSYAASIANRGRGGGTESKDYYPCIEPVYHKVPNIHAVLQSFDAMALLCQARTPNSLTWMSQLETTQWLHYLSGLLESAVHIAHTLCVEARPVLVHCSDGWDRTTQATALTEILLDPFYRTFEGFTTLVKREWLSFGHKFASRCGHPSADLKDNIEYSPVFLQWLDLIHQLMLQFPMAFEYNETFLIKLGTHVYSHLFGNFLCNREQDRVNMKGKTLDVWVMMNKKRADFVNYLYSPGDSDVIIPRFGVQYLRVWSRMYMQPVRQVMPGGRDIEAGSSLLSPAVATTAPAPMSTINNSTFDMAVRSVCVGKSSSKSCLLDCLREQNRNKGSAEVVRSQSEQCSRSSSPATVGDSPRRRQHSSDDMAAGDAAAFKKASSVISPSPARSIPRSSAIEARGGLSSSYEYVNWSPPTSGKANVYRPPSISGRERASTAGCSASPSQGSSSGFAVASASVVSTPKRRRAAAAALAEGHSVEEALAGSADDASVNRTSQSSADEALTPRNELSRSGASMEDPADTVMTTASCPEHSDMPVSADGANCSTGAKSCATKCNKSKKNTQRKVKASTSHTRGLVPVQADKSAAADIAATSSSRSDSELLYRQKISAGGDSGCPSPPSSPPSSLPVSDQEGAAPPDEEEDAYVIPSYLVDSDGLPLLYDPVQTLLYKRKAQDDRKMADLVAQNRKLQSLLQKANISNHSLPNSVSSGSSLNSLQPIVPLEEEVSDGSLSHSWESVCEKEAQPTRWLPDHAVSNCQGCDVVFWVYTRRHHCRSCGGVFCGTCSDYYVPVPNEHLPEPVRVCCRCYDKLDGPLYHRQKALALAQA